MLENQHARFLARTPGRLSRGALAGGLVFGLVSVAACCRPYGPAPRPGVPQSPAGASAAPAATPAPTPLPDRLVVAESAWSDLPGWGGNSLGSALPALLRSCEVWRGQGEATPVGKGGTAGTVADWLPLCDRLQTLGEAETASPSNPTALDQPTDPEAGAQADDGARALFEELLRPVVVSNRGEREGLFTGYYEPHLYGSRTPSARYRVPLYVRPPELVTVDLGLFRPDLAGRRIAGTVREGALVPYLDRTAVDRGALAGRGLELVWVDDPVDAFFLEIQGSGRIALEEGGELRVGYAGQNGFPYLAIGRELVARGAMSKEQVSMQSIREWLEAHPEEATEVMQKNASYVFFREQLGEGPLGSLGVPLTPGRSLAVDPLFVPLGVPLWLDTTLPAADGGESWLQRLVVAQDTGGAIRGPVRGDVFWGASEEAADLAGRMRQRGRLWLLLPRTVALPAELLSVDEPDEAGPR